MYYLRYVKPSNGMLLCLVAFNILPGIYIYYNKYYEGLYGAISFEKYNIGLNWYFLTTILFTLVFIFTVFLLSNFFKLIRKSKKLKLLPSKVNKENSTFLLNVFSKKKYYYDINFIDKIYYLGHFSCFLVWLYFSLGGYEKLLLFGKDVDHWEYRIIGYDDRSRIIIALLEIARRVVLPFACIYLFSIRKIDSSYHSKLTSFYFLFSLLIAGLVTLDRGPILLILIMLVYLKYCFNNGNFFKTILLSIVTLCSILFFGGLVTFLQYNISHFSFFDILESGNRFFWHRTIIVPSVASIELSFCEFPFDSEKLLLKFSRLGALIGRDYIAIEGKNALYVTPVGFIADIWRNFGFIGCLVVSFLLGIYFTLIDYFVLNADPITKIAGTFTSLSLCFFFVFGVFFSQGVFFQLFFLFLFLFLLRNNGTPKIKLD